MEKQDRAGSPGPAEQGRARVVLGRPGPATLVALACHAGRFDGADWEQIQRMAAPLKPTPVPSNAHADDPAALGQQLFFDRMLAGEGGISCASCHDPEKGYGDGLPTAKGVGWGRSARRRCGTWRRRAPGATEEHFFTLDAVVKHYLTVRVLPPQGPQVTGTLDPASGSIPGNMGALTAFLMMLGEAP